ncbi:MAG TPA: ketopantoate reductase C-terminal domain-containing protein [Spirochaetia bacterium]|nr:ketopantoate reductase C-terminal domain-containing protein [Spirochaetia bacterium]
MFENADIFVIGGGAIGMALAATLVDEGRKVTVVRTRVNAQPIGNCGVAVEYGEGETVSAPLDMARLSDLWNLGDGIFVITTKATANSFIAAELTRRLARGPIVVMQNGLSVETPFVDSGFTDVHRCILYATSQETDDGRFRFRPVAASPVGAVRGNPAIVGDVVNHLNTARFPFRMEERIEGEVWRKTIMNAVFNSVCPLLDVDNGIFHRDQQVAAIAIDLIREMMQVTERLGFSFTEGELLEQLLLISRRSDGQLISTLQDLKKGNETEIEFLNLEIARIAESLSPAIQVDKTKLLGQLVRIKSIATEHNSAGVAG